MNLFIFDVLSDEKKLYESDGDSASELDVVNARASTRRADSSILKFEIATDRAVDEEAQIGFCVCWCDSIEA